MTRKTPDIWIAGSAALMLFAAMVSLRAGGDADVESSQGVVVVKHEKPAVVQPTAGIAPTPASATTPLAEPDTPFVATPEILKALSLPSQAVFRKTALADRSDGVICGEVSKSPRDSNFKRFVYIGSAKSGFIDDGGTVFKQISATSCTSRD